MKVLEELADEGVPIARKIVDWRQLTKLKSTYTDAIPGYIHPETGRVHTDYALASTSTGRLSSSEPNLQNIPIRTEEGRAIRRAFIADDGHKLVSADYSQIELRVLAHMADIPQLVKAFEDGLDIHAMTASEMFGVPVEGMDPNVRRRAKAINFGIIYGISAFGLAAQLSIPRGEAADYINRYFERFPGIRDYMDKTKAFCREHLYVETLFGRRAHYPEIRSSQPSLRAFQERAAINAPIQGSAADIIRRAMIRMDEALEEARPQRPDAAAGARRAGVRGAGRRDRRHDPGDPPRDGERRACRRWRSACRSMWMHERRTIGTRRIRRASASPSPPPAPELRTIWLGYLPHRRWPEPGDERVRSTQSAFVRRS